LTIFFAHFHLFDFADPLHYQQLIVEKLDDLLDIPIS